MTTKRTESEIYAADKARLDQILENQGEDEAIRSAEQAVEQYTKALNTSYGNTYGEELLASIRFHTGWLEAKAFDTAAQKAADSVTHDTTLIPTRRIRRESI